MAYNSEQKKEILTFIWDKLERAIQNEPEECNNIPVWKSIAFILDQYNSEEFFGILSLKIAGNKCWSPKIEEQTFKLNGMYTEIDKVIDDLT